MRYWLALIDEKNWGILIEKEIYALKKEKDFNKINNGDAIVFYVKPCKIGGIYLISNLELTREVLFEDKDFKFKVSLKKEIIPKEFLKLKSGKKIDSIINDLSLFKNSKRWGAVLMGKNVVEISREDYNKIKNKLNDIT